MKRNKYGKTIIACYIGYIFQAVVNNYIPLLFLTLHSTYNIPLNQIATLITVNFTVQLTVDFLSAFFIEKIGWRISIVSSQILGALGLVMFAFLPDIMPNPFVGMVIGVILYAIGGGLNEVLVSPIVESCPSDNKERMMSLLHSFYCWGQVFVVLVSTAVFAVFGTEIWKILAVFWALIPAFNAVLFSFVPFAPLVEEGKGMPFKALIRRKTFFRFALMMLCAGASELAVSQWASAFAELALNVSKSIGDLAGPMLFAIFMGTARAVYAKYADEISLNKAMIFSSALCVISYLMISLVPNSVVGFIGCGICGFSVGIMWPGTLSSASASIRTGGTTMFALLALAGDLGCSVGPTITGFIGGSDGSQIRLGILTATVFPLLMLISSIAGRKD